jgi:[acyl-carrier-protein] S-malonyltransferase
MIRESLYGVSFNIQKSTYKDLDSSNIALLYSGQGSAEPKMYLSEYRKNPIFSKHLKIAEGIAHAHGLDSPIKYILGEDFGSVDKIHIVRNLALFACQSAVTQSLLEKNFEPLYLTGHSFGEYAALVGAGIISFELGCEIVLQRDLACPAPHSLGAMIAVSGTDAEISSALSGKTYWLANLNSQRQSVVSLALKDLSEISTKLRSARLAHIVLKDVPQPYHSALMEESAVKFKKIIDGLELLPSPARAHFLSSVECQLIRAGETVEIPKLKSILVQQLLKPVDFRKQLALVYQADCRSFVEIGPKDLLKGFVQSTFSNHAVAKNASHFFLAQDADESQAIDLSKTENSPWLKRLMSIISEVTGYKDSDIAMTSRFQDDLAIDSIKKAEILFRTLKAANVEPTGDLSISKFSKIFEVVDYLDSSFTEQLKAPTAALSFVRMSTHWEPGKIAFLPRKSKTSSVEPRIFEIHNLNETENLRNEISSYFESLKSKSGAQWIIFDNYKAALKDNLPSQDLSFFLFLQDLAKNLEQLPSDQHLTIFLLNSTLASSTSLAMASAFKALKKETQGFFFKHLVIDQSLEQLGEEILTAEYSDHVSIDVKLKNNQRFVRELKHHPLPFLAKVNGPIKTVFAIGGSRGINRELLQRLGAEFRGAQFFVLGRSPEADPQVQKSLQNFRSLGMDVSYLEGDAADYQTLKAAFQKATEIHGSIDLVLNSAGMEVSRRLSERQSADIRSELSSKLDPARNLLKLSSEFKIGRVFVSSSIVSYFGNDGQTVYSYANEALSQMYLGIETETKFTTINWPAWKQVGMTENLGILQKLLEKGISLIDPKVACDLFMDEVETPPEKNESLFLIEPNDTFLLKYGLLETDRKRSILGGASSAHEFETLLDLSTDLYLRDHRVRDQAIVPLSLTASLFVCLGKAFFGKIPTLTDFRFFSPIILRDEKNWIRSNLKPSLESELKGTGQIRTSIIHTESGFLNKPLDREFATFDLQGYVESSPKEIYDFGKGLIDLDANIQYLKKVFEDKDKKNIYAEFDINEIQERSPDKFFNFLFQILEAGIQVAGTLGVLRERKPTLPQKFASLAIDDFIMSGDTVLIYPVAKHTLENGFAADIFFVDPITNRVLMKVIDMEYEFVGWGSGKV